MYTALLTWYAMLLIHESGSGRNSRRVRTFARAIGSPGVDQSGLRAGSRTGCGRALLPVDAQSESQNRLRRLIARTVRSTQRGHSELARNSGHFATHADSQS